jgi:phage recombination protein Bet|nr:MAG TPA: recombination protein [Caudoviricetes sp.]
MEDAKKAMALAKRKETLAKKKKTKKIKSIYETVASDMPSEWIKSDANKLELVKSIHKDILGLDGNGRLRPIGDFVKFMNIANQAGLNPFLNEIYGLYIYDKSVGGEKLVVVTGINGFRKAAAMDNLAAMKYVGSDEPVIEFKEGKLPDYADLFAGRKIPEKVSVAIKGLNPITGEIQTVAVGVAYWDEYVRLVKEKKYVDGESQLTGRKIPNTNWLEKPIIMLKKTAEADGLRKAYPNKLNAIYERTEFDHVDPEPDDEVQSISEAIEARRSEGNVFEKKITEALEG